MKKILRRGALGVISLLPITFVGLFIARSTLSFIKGYEAFPATALVSPLVVASASTIFLLFFFGWRVFRQYRDPEREKLFLLLLWGNAFAFPWFWYHYCRNDKPEAAGSDSTDSTGQ